jgi:hypothetical protein
MLPGQEQLSVPHKKENCYLGLVELVGQLGLLEADANGCTSFWQPQLLRWSIRGPKLSRQVPAKFRVQVINEHDETRLDCYALHNGPYKK